MNYEKILKDNLLFNSELSVAVSSANTSASTLVFGDRVVESTLFATPPDSYEKYDLSSIYLDDLVFSIIYDKVGNWSLVNFEYFFSSSGSWSGGLVYNKNTSTIDFQFVQFPVFKTVSIPAINDDLSHQIIITLNSTTNTWNFYQDGALISTLVDAIPNITLSNLSVLGAGVSDDDSPNASIVDFSLFKLSDLMAGGMSEAEIVSYLYSNTFNNGKFKFVYEYSDVVINRLEQNRDSIITRALRMCGVISSFQTPNSNDIEIGATVLQNILEDLQNESYKQFQVENRIYSLRASDCVLGSDGKSYRCILPHKADVSNRPVTGIKYKKYWEQAGTATLNWTIGVCYETIGVFNLDNDTQEVLSIHLTEDYSDDLPVEMIDSKRYSEIEIKHQTGRPYEAYVYYGIDYPVLYLHNYPDSTNYLVNCLIVKKVNNISEANESMETYKNMYNAITYRLAEYLADEYDVSTGKKQRLMLEAEKLMRRAMNSDIPRETSNITYGAY